MVYLFCGILQLQLDKCQNIMWSPSNGHSTSMIWLRNFLLIELNSMFANQSRNLCTALPFQSQPQLASPAYQTLNTGSGELSSSILPLIRTECTYQTKVPGSRLASFSLPINLPSKRNTGPASIMGGANILRVQRLSTISSQLSCEKSGRKVFFYERK